MIRALLMMALTIPLVAQGPPAGITGVSAPKWEVPQWYQLPKGVEQLEVEDLRGKVVYLFTFQSW